MNRVDYLLSINVNSLSREDKLSIKNLGPHQPKDFSLYVKDGKQNRHFQIEWYDRFPWLTASPERKCLFCFNCLLFGDGTSESPWTKTGFDSLKNFHDRASKHQKSNNHLDSTTYLKTIGTDNIACQIDGSGHRLSIQRHNERVAKNRKLLEEVIQCIVFCGVNELPLRGHDDRHSSSKRGVYPILIRLLADLKRTFNEQIEIATVGKYTSSQIQNEILDSIYLVYIDELKERIKNAHFVSVETDETSDVSCRSQFVIVLRLLVDNAPVEHFLKFIYVSDRSADGLYNVIKEELDTFQVKEKLIAQTYDGAGVMSVQRLLKKDYPYAHFVHCYAHQTDLILKKASRVVLDARIFFANVSGFSTFFHYPNRAEALREITRRCLPRACETRWNFQSRVVNSVSDFKNEIMICLENIIASDNWDDDTTREAVGLLSLLEDDMFNYYLKFFKKLFLHTEVLFKQFQTRISTGKGVTNCAEIFASSVNDIKNSLPEEPATCKRKRKTNPNTSAKEICDILVTQMKDRFGKSSFLPSFVVLDPTHFNAHKETFPSDHINTLIKHYPFLSKESLSNELEVIYNNDTFNNENVSTALDLFKIITNSGLADTFDQVNLLLQIVLTIPMSSSEPERCFSTLKRIKTFLRNSMGQERLNALAVLTTHSDIFTKDKDFIIKVIERFASLKERKLDLNFK